MMSHITVIELREKVHSLRQRYNYINILRSEMLIILYYLKMKCAHLMIVHVFNKCRNVHSIDTAYIIVN